jgi:dihydroorotate dehydrogenase
MNFYSLLKPLLFSVSPETAHQLAMKSLKFLDRTPGLKALLVRYSQDPVFDQEVELFGLKFRNRVGLAAGFDKDAKYIDALSKLGFGHIEIGTLTPRAQQGNPKPRLHRIVDERALINRMGFNNEGLERAAERLKKRKSSLIVGGNIGKNKITRRELAIEDYEKGFEALFDLVDYFTLNLSSPNTPGLRELQERDYLKQLFRSLKEKNKRRAGSKPILLKIAPDLNDAQLDGILEACYDHEIPGIIATNTTIERPLISFTGEQIERLGAGGLSGAPLMAASTDMVRKIKERAGDRLEVIAVGGIFSSDDLKRKLDAGASLVQVFTGFIYEGPFFVKNLLKKTSRLK